MRNQFQDWKSVTGLGAGTRGLKRSTGTFTTATADGITLANDGGGVTVSRSEARRVSTASMSRKKRTLIGLAIGGATWWLARPLLRERVWELLMARCLVVPVLFIGLRRTR